MEVKIISTQIVKPSSPTPSHLRELMFSFLDQKNCSLTVPAVLFYRALPDEATPLDIARLRTGLSETLTCFYPLAGRYKTWGTIICNDEGVPFIEAHVNCPISALISSPTSSNVDFLSFYPPGENLQKSGIHLAIQVNVFTCGGFAIGWYHTHKVTDGVSVSTFFQHWAALVTQRYKDASQTKPDFRSGAISFSPLPEEDKPMTPEQNETEEKKETNNSFFSNRIEVRSFVFKNEAVTELKAKSVSDHVTNPSRFEAVSGFIWKQILLASPKEGRSMLSIVVDIRPRTDPPMPNGSIGNLVETAFVRAQKRAELPEFVSEIRGSITKIKELASEYQSENRGEAREKHWKGFINNFIECKGKDVYILTSWCKSAGYSNVDFGFGKPIWIVPLDDKFKPSNNLRNTIVLTEVSDLNGDGFEAWLFMEEEVIKFLESNSEFLAFASPNFGRKCDSDTDDMC
ncbi:hypothetical protein RND81_04G031800 [Saponaria officinalis]|uniref:Transferase n=1 Tax=Saponaria officinalis TaxID=3572 RepID=A0AAW1LCJ0_SAPOF